MWQLKDFISILLIFFCVSSASCQAATKPVQASIVMNADTGYIYESNNSNIITYPASLTKIMTLYLIFEALESKRLKLTTRMPVSHFATLQKPCKLGLSAGQQLTVLDVILGLVTKSANDAAVVVAEHFAGSEQKFAEKMTEKARYLGMKNTVFRNASGLPNPLQCTTAHDMAKLAQALYKRFPKYYQYFATKKFIFKGQIHRNHNRLLDSYPGVDGVKTGFINASGFNHAASAKRQGLRLIVVVMGGASWRARDQKIMNLFDKTFSIALGNKIDKFYAKDDNISSNVLTKKPIANESDTPVHSSTNLLVKSSPIQSIQSSTSKSIKRNQINENTKPNNQIIRNSDKIICEVHLGHFNKGQKGKSTAEKLQQKYKIFGAKNLIVINKKHPKKLYRVHIKNLTQAQAKKICEDKSVKNMKCKVIRQERQNQLR